MENKKNPSKFSVLIIDTIAKNGINQIQEMGCNVHYNPLLEKDALNKSLSSYNPHVLIVRSTKITAEHISLASNLSLIVRAGAGYDNIDLQKASELGIFVSNCPGKNAIAVAELTIGLIIACDRKIPNQSQDFHNGYWNKKNYSKSEGLKGKSLGVIGLGKIGLEVAKRAKSFGMQLHGWSKNSDQPAAEKHDIEWESSLINLAKKSDVISVHLSSTNETKGLLDGTFFQSLNQGAIFINTSRAEIVNELEMIKAVKEKSIKVGLDVFEEEPTHKHGKFTSRLQNLPIHVTHHIGASTNQAQKAIANEAINIVKEYITKGNIKNCVNIESTSTATSKLTIRHYNKPGVLAHALQILSEANINVEAMQNTIYEGNKAASARLMLSNIPNKTLISSIQNHKHIISIDSSNIRSNP